MSLLLFIFYTVYFAFCHSLYPQMYEQQNNTVSP